jgi:DNA processing protein
MNPGQIDALLTLSLAPGLGPTLTRRCMEKLGSAAAVLEASPAELSEVEGIGPGSAEAMRRGIDGLGDGRALAREKELIAGHGVTVLARDDAAYPALLRHIPDPPPLLYVRGQMVKEDALAVALVGARRCTGYGREQADRLGAFCAQAGLCVVSGGAYGIDAAAHRAALRVGGRTIAVLGSGLADPYPADHVPLFDQIAQGGHNGDSGGGAVISELPMSAPPRPQNFPRRNRIISGLALGVLVVEATTRSGALITARLCSEEHNREVMAVPGRADSPASAGCHRMIREGWARLVTSGPEVLEALTDAGSLYGAMVPQAGGVTDSGGTAGAATTSLAAGVTAVQRKILDQLDESRTPDQLAAVTGLAMSALQAELMVMQIRGLVERRDGYFSRKGKGG